MPHLILFSFLIFAVWLIRRDTASRTGISGALWIPTLWVGIISSRPISAWLNLGGGGDSLDGSPFDRLFYLSLILAGLFVLARRAINWGWLLTQNWPVLIFYLFLLISVIWTNSPFSSFKRWFKETGNIVMALVILTEASPLQAFRAVFVRCAYLLIPLSIIFIRYFPGLGRTYNRHSGGMEAIGVTFQKNSLGTMVLACGLVFLWDWLERSRPGAPPRKTVDRYASIAVGLIAIWLIHLSDSKTSILSLAVGCFILVSIRLPFLRRRISALGFYTLFGAGVFFLLDRSIGVTEAIVTSLGRNMTFTGRTEVWRELLNVGTDPLLGTGFMSFWDDPHFQSKLPEWVAFSAHNGYLEIYLAGGAIGIAVLALMILGTGARINRALSAGNEYSTVRFAIFVMMLIANFSESNFACMTPLGFLFLLAAIGEARPEVKPSYYSFAEAPSAFPAEDEIVRDSDTGLRAQT
jgi:exopolysaccharide production protein ExoQ